MSIQLDLSTLTPEALAALADLVSVHAEEFREGINRHTATKIVNLTAHDVVVYGEKYAPFTEPVVIHSDADQYEIARVFSHFEKAADINGLPIYVAGTTSTFNLPEPQPGTLYLISRDVAMANPDRADLVCPSQTIRTPNGGVDGCRILVFPNGVPEWAHQ